MKSRNQIAIYITSSLLLATAITLFYWTNKLVAKHHAKTDMQLIEKNELLKRKIKQVNETLIINMNIHYHCRLRYLVGRTIQFCERLCDKNKPRPKDFICRGMEQSRWRVFISKYRRFLKEKKPPDISIPKVRILQESIQNGLLLLKTGYTYSSQICRNKNIHSTYNRVCLGKDPFYENLGKEYKKIAKLCPNPNQVLENPMRDITVNKSFGYNLIQGVKIEGFPNQEEINPIGQNNGGHRVNDLFPCGLNPDYMPKNNLIKVVSSKRDLIMTVNFPPVATGVFRAEYDVVFYVNKRRLKSINSLSL